MVTVSPYYHSLTKRIFDLGLASSLLLLASPLLVLIAVIVLISAGWPVIFVQKRLGLNKSAFHLYKFRTMKKGAEKEESTLKRQNQAPAPMFKIFDDPRYVGLGKHLSHYGLDELPQLINILKGEMSFVGPRPLPPYQAKKLDSSWNFRYQVKPGIFSEWSLSPLRHTTLKKWKELEKKTVKEGSLAYELKIILATTLRHWFTIFWATS